MRPTCVVAEQGHENFFNLTEFGVYEYVLRPSDGVYELRV